jgi:DNA-binding transcriptional MerR regulator/methylmalonyl-CoA mutase cobalamin-binding subunit
MNEFIAQPDVTLSIAAVERDTGLSKDTLRVWERRYGFPMPRRDAFGERCYGTDEVDKLRLVKRLMDGGHRPGKIVHRSSAELQELAQALAPPAASPPCADLDGYLNLLKTHRVDELRRSLSQELVRVGLARFVAESIAPLTVLVGECWARGSIEIFEEHLFTELVQVLLRNAINQIPEPGGRPDILLTTFPQEPHGLGLLMAEALFSLDGCKCVSLGVQTPIWDIARAAQAQRVDIVALSFSPVVNGHQLIEGLIELTHRLGPSVEIWAGGTHPLLKRRPPLNVRTLSGLADLHLAVAEWRSRAAARGDRAAS